MYLQCIYEILNSLVENLARKRCIIDNFGCLNASVYIFMTVILHMTVCLADVFTF